MSISKELRAFNDEKMSIHNQIVDLQDSMKDLDIKRSDCIRDALIELNTFLVNNELLTAFNKIYSFDNGYSFGSMVEHLTFSKNFSIKVRHHLGKFRVKFWVQNREREFVTFKSCSFPYSIFDYDGLKKQLVAFKSKRMESRRLDNIKKSLYGASGKFINSVEKFISDNIGKY